MTLCEDCIHVLRRIGKTVDCEAHRFSVKSKKKCEAYLSIESEMLPHPYIIYSL